MAVAWGRETAAATGPGWVGGSGALSVGALVKWLVEVWAPPMVELLELTMVEAWAMQSAGEWASTTLKSHTLNLIRSRPYF